MRMLGAISAVALFGAMAATGAIADERTSPATPAAPAAPDTRSPVPVPQKSDENTTAPVQPPNTLPNAGGSQSGTSSGASGTAGPYNPTPREQDSGSAVQ